MKLLIQRVSSSHVHVDGELVGETGKGLLVLIGVHEQDGEEDFQWCLKKLLDMRIFSDNEGKMNLSLKDVDAELMLISQFTLYASTKKGNRPSFITAAKPDHAILLYEKFIEECEKELGKKVARGIFGADMKVSLVNDGPVTIIIDSLNKE